MPNFAPPSQTAPYEPKISQYYKTVLQVPGRAVNTVQDISRNMADGLYVGATADTDVYDKTGAIQTFTSGTSTSKGIMLHWSKTRFQLSESDSLMVQARFTLRFNSFTCTAGANTGNGTVNSTSCRGLPGTIVGIYKATLTSATNFTVTDPNGTVMGYGSTAVAYTGPGINFTMVAGGTPFIAGDYWTITTVAPSAYLFGNNGNGSLFGINLLWSSTNTLVLSYKVGTGGTGGTGTVNCLPTTLAILPETFYNLSLFIFGDSKRIDAYLNGQYNLTNINTAIIADSNSSFNTLNASPSNLGLGFSADNSLTSNSLAKMVSYETFNLVIIPGASGKRIANPGWLDIEFNRQPRRIFTDSEIVGA